MADLNNLPITKKSVSRKFGVSEVTLTKTLKKLNEYKKIILNTELTIICAKKMDENKKSVQMPKELVDKFNKMGFDTTVHADLEIEDDEFNIDSINSVDELIDYIDSINDDIYSAITTTDSEYKDVIGKMTKAF